VSVLAIIPARSGSKGIPGKNLRKLGGESLVSRAMTCAVQVGCDPVVISTDLDAFAVDGVVQPPFRVVWRTPELAGDTVPMIDVVRHVLESIPGPDDQIIVLLQPTAVFRTAAHVARGIALLRYTLVDSVVSVVDIGVRDQVLHIGEHGRLEPLLSGMYWHNVPPNRQDQPRAYRRDGTVYAFWRRTVINYGHLYGAYVVPLIIPPDETCDLDTESDWADVVRRFNEHV